MNSEHPFSVVLLCKFLPNKVVIRHDYTRIRYFTSYIWYKFWIRVLKPRKHTPVISPQKARLGLCSIHIFRLRKCIARIWSPWAYPACNHEPVPVVCSSRSLLFVVSPGSAGFYSSWNPKKQILQMMDSNVDVDFPKGNSLESTLGSFLLI